MTQAMVLGGLRRCEVLGLRLGDLRLGEWRVLIIEGKGGHERLVPLSPTFFSTVARYMDHERPETTSDALFVALKGTPRGQPLSIPGLAQIIRDARRHAELSHGTCHELRHTCLPATRGGHGHRSHPGPGRTPLHHLDPGLSPPQRGLARRRVPPGRRSHRGPGARGVSPMNALARSQPLPQRRPGGGTPEVTWAEIAVRAPVMVATMASYLDQLEVSARPGTVAAAELTLRFFAHRVTEADPSCVSVARPRRAHIEDFKTWLLKRRGRTGKPLATMTIRHRLSTVRTFFERIMEWDYDDAPARLFVYMSDFPALDEPLPKFLDDPTAAKFMAALAEDPDLRRSTSWSNCWPAPASASASSPGSKTTPWSARETAIVSTSPSASCTTTATCHCSRCWST